MCLVGSLVRKTLILVIHPEVRYDHRQGIKLLSAVHLLQLFQCVLGLALLKCVSVLARHSAKKSQDERVGIVFGRSIGTGLRAHIRPGGPHEQTPGCTVLVEGECVEFTGGYACGGSL